MISMISGVNCSGRIHCVKYHVTTS